MDNNTTPDGTRIYTPRKKIIPSGSTNILTDTDLENGRYTSVNDENIALGKKWVDDIEL